MAYLDLAPAISALRSRPEEFEFSGSVLHHRPSKHRFLFQADGDVQIFADCGCITLQTTREQAQHFNDAYKEWHLSYWRPIEINREFASHFTMSLWRRIAVRLLNFAISILLRSPRKHTVSVRPVQSLT